MPKYTFTFKKDDVFVDFSSTDREVVERQFQVWVDSASAYSQTHSPKAKEKTADKPVEKEKEKKVSAPIEEKLAEKPSRKNKPEPPKEEVKVVEEPAEETIEEIQAPPEVQEIIEEKSSEEPHEKEVQEEPKEVFDKASTLLKTINTIQNEETEPQEEEKAPQMPDFEKVLENSIENSTFEPVKTRDIDFLELINSKNTQDKFHYFIITAYYLLEQEHLDRFSLKQINAKLMQNLSIIADHTVLQDAINAGFVELVPDLTGSSDASEYKLTEKGETFFHKEI